MYNYVMANKNTNRLHMLTNSFDETISNHLSCIDDEEYSTAEDYKSLVLDLLVECRNYYTQMDAIVDGLKETDNGLLNINRKDDERIKPHSDNEFKKRFIGIR